MAFEKFASEDAAFHWMVNFAFARRNCTPEEEKFLLGRKYTAEVGLGPGAPEGNQNAKKQSGEKGLIVFNGPRSRNPTRKRIAEEAGVSEHMVRDAVEYADAVDKLGLATGEKGLLPDDAGRLDILAVVRGEPDV